MLDVEVKETIERYVLDEGVRVGEIATQPESGEYIFLPLPLHFFTVEHLEQIINEMERLC